MEKSIDNQSVLVQIPKKRNEQNQRTQPKHNNLF